MDIYHHVTWFHSCETQTSWESIKSESLTGKVHHNYEEENNVFLKKTFGL